MKTIKIKLVILGDMSSGKSSILNRFVNNNFISNNSSTIGVDFFKKSIEYNNSIYDLFIWDTSGQEKFSSIVTSYYRNVTAALIVFDLKNLESFKNINKWLDEVYCYCNSKIVIRIIGNKNDVKIDTRENINELCRTNNLKYIETSAKTNHNIDTLFLDIVKEIDLKLIEGKLDPIAKNGINIKDTFNIDLNNKELKPKCCVIL